MATYKHLRSSTANKRPTTSIADGQLAINTNTASPGLFFKDSAGTGIVKVGPVHVGTTAPNSSPAGSSGNYVGEQWLDTSVSPAQMKVWNGTVWVGIVADELPVSKLQDGAARQLIQTDAAGTGVEWTSNVDVPGTLDVTSTATFDSIASHPLGTAGAPTVTFTGDTNTGLYSPGADQVAISTNGTGRLFVDANGRVGVGTSPSYTLDVAGSTSTARLGKLQILNDAPFITGANIDSGANTVALGSSGNAPALFFTNNTERMRLDSSGRLGLGSSAPQSLLQVGGYSGSNGITIGAGSSSYSFIYLADGTGGTEAYRGYLQYNHATDKLELGSAGSTAITVDSSQRVGIGTTSPGSYSSAADDLVVAGSGDTGITIAAGSSSYSVVYFADGTTGSEPYRGVVGYNHASDALVFFTAGLLRSTIDSAGRLLVGTSSTSGDTRAIFQGTSSNNWAVVRMCANTTSPTDLGYLVFGDSNHVNAAWINAAKDGGTWTSGSSHPTRLVFSTTADGASSPTERMRIGQNGNVGIGNVNSDSIRLYVKGVDATGSNYSFYLENGSAAECFYVRNDGVVATGTAGSSPYNNTTASAANVFVTSGGVLQRSTSSIKYKRNVADAVHGLPELLQLRPVTYQSKSDADGDVQYGGLIAEDVDAAGLSEFVQYAEDGTPDALAYGNMVSLCIKAIQDQQVIIAELQAKVAVLEAK